MNKARHPLALAGFVVLGGLSAGLLMAMTVPTTMKRDAEDWRDLIGARDTAPSSTPVLAFEAPPQDLEPGRFEAVAWQTAQQEYEASRAAMFADDTWSDLPTDVEMHLDATPKPERLPAALLAGRSEPEDDMLAQSADPAGRAARAARQAVADVRTAVLSDDHDAEIADGEPSDMAMPADLDS